MPHTRSAAKRMRQSWKRNQKNKNARTAVKTHMKRVAEATAAGDLVRAQSELRLAMTKIDKAAKVHAIHWNSAARKKAQASHLVAVLAKKGPAKPSK